MKRAVSWLGVIALLLVIAAWLPLRMSLPILDGEHTISGLESSVDITYDQHQRPYVHAQTLGDALLAEGWLHARHRSWQMELFRRAGKGRLAELLGGELLETDKMLWRFGVPQLAARLEKNAGNELQRFKDERTSVE